MSGQGTRKPLIRRPAGVRQGHRPIFTNEICPAVKLDGEQIVEFLVHTLHLKRLAERNLAGMLQCIIEQENAAMQYIFPWPLLEYPVPVLFFL